MFHLLHGLHALLDHRPADLQISGYSDCRENIQDIELSEQLCLKRNAFLAMNEREGSAVFGIPDILCPVICVLIINAIGYCLHGIMNAIIPDEVAVIVQDSEAVFRQHLDHLHLLMDDVLLASERCQMLRAD